MLRVITTPLNAAVVELSPLAVFGNRTLVIAITLTSFKICILADVSLILCSKYLRIRRCELSEFLLYVQYSGGHVGFQSGDLPSLLMVMFS